MSTPYCSLKQMQKELTKLAFFFFLCLCEMLIDLFSFFDDLHLHTFLCSLSTNPVYRECKTHSAYYLNFKHDFLSGFYEFVATEYLSLLGVWKCRLSIFTRAHRAQPIQVQRYNENSS